MTTAFAIESETNDDHVDLGYRHHLPWIRCHVCGETWGQGTIYEFPALSFDFLDQPVFNIKEKPALLVANAVTVAEFERVKGRITKAAGRMINLFPGAGIGTLAGTTSKLVLDDFIWGRICFPQISRKANEILRSEGIVLRTAPLQLSYRGKPIDSHLAIQIEPVPLATEETLRAYTVVHCSTCDNYRQVEVKPPGGGYRLRRSAWPTGEHLVSFAELGGVIVSDSFIAAVRKHGLTGISFRDCGTLV